MHVPCSPVRALPAASPSAARAGAECADVQEAVAEPEPVAVAAVVAAVVNPTAPPRAESQLTLVDELLLLGVKEDAGHTLILWNSAMSVGLRGCILAELALCGRLALAEARGLGPAERRLVVADRRATSDSLLNEALGCVSAPGAAPAGGQPVDYWIPLLAGDTWSLQKMRLALKNVRERALDSLVAKGLLQPTGPTLGALMTLDFGGSHALQPTAAVRKAALLDRVRAVLLSYPAGPNAKDRTPLPSRDIVLCCLAFSCNVLDEAISGFSNQQRKQAATR